MDCVFCKIVNGEIPSYTLYEDDIVKVFLDINPNTTGHTLIIPKKHFKDFDEIDNETLSYIFSVARKIKKLLEDNLDTDGMSFAQNNGISQEVKHYHLHLIPNYKNEVKMSVEEVYNKIKKSI